MYSSIVQFLVTSTLFFLEANVALLLDYINLNFSCFVDFMLHYHHCSISNLRKNINTDSNYQKNAR